MNKNLLWVAIGDSFTYLDDHPEEGDFRFTRGYVTRTLARLPFPTRAKRFGINGSTTADWLDFHPPAADFYSVLLGTNDWNAAVYPLGDAAAFRAAIPGTTLGNLGVLLAHLRAVSPAAPIFVMNPTERATFVYTKDWHNHAADSLHPRRYGTLKRYAEAIRDAVSGDGVIAVDLHSLSGFRVDTAVRFMRVRIDGAIRDLRYPESSSFVFDPATDVYPYPPEVQALTYDGLHPSDAGAERIAEVLSAAIIRRFS